MWGQVSMNKALRAFLSGRTVKVVDFNAETVLGLEEVLQRFEQGAVFFTETVATENLDFSEAVEDMASDAELAELKKTNADLKEKLDRLASEYGDLSMKYSELDAAYAIAQNPAPDPEQSAPKKRGKKTVDDVEREYANRKITDLKGLRALRDAGWSAKKLAEEFRCSEATVYNTLKRLEEQEAEA